VFAPDNVRVPVPILTSEPPLPEMTPLTTVDRLFEPTVSSLAPRLKVPPPAIDPALSLPWPFGPKLLEKSVTATALLATAALPAVLVLLKFRLPLLVIVALPAVLLLLKFKPPLLVMVALPAVLVLLKFRPPLFVMALPPAVLLSLKNRPKLFVMLALPAVLLFRKYR